MDAHHRDVHRVTHKYVQHNPYIYLLTICLLTDRRMDSELMRQCTGNLVGIRQDVWVRPYRHVYMTIQSPWRRIHLWSLTTLSIQWHPYGMIPLLLGNSPFLGCCPSQWTKTTSLVIKVDEMQFFKAGIKWIILSSCNINTRVNLTLNSSDTSVIAQFRHLLMQLAGCPCCLCAAVRAAIPLPVLN